MLPKLAHGDRIPAIKSEVLGSGDQRWNPTVVASRWAVDVARGAQTLPLLLGHDPASHTIPARAQISARLRNQKKAHDSPIADATIDTMSSGRDVHRPRRRRRCPRMARCTTPGESSRRPTQQEVPLAQSRSRADRRRRRMSDAQLQTSAGKVLWQLTMSVDGFLAGANHEMDWMSGSRFVRAWSRTTSTTGAVLGESKWVGAYIWPGAVIDEIDLHIALVSARRGRPPVRQPRRRADPPPPNR